VSAIVSYDEVRSYRNVNGNGTRVG
jgi:hypothetical protein